MHVRLALYMSHRNKRARKRKGSEGYVYVTGVTLAYDISCMYTYVYI